MADKGMRIMGRGDDGNAKSLKTNNSGELNIQSNGVLIKEDVLIDNVVVNANSATGNISLNLTGREKEVWLYVSNEKHPVNVRTSPRSGSNVGLANAAGYTDNLFPTGALTTINPLNNPTRLFYVPDGFFSKTILNETVESYAEAKALTHSYHKNSVVRVFNDSAENVNVTVWVVRIYG